MAAGRAPNIDSGCYRFSLLIRSQEDLPTDFQIPSDYTFQTSLFLPRDDSDWFRRSRFPPRIHVHASREFTALKPSLIKCEGASIALRDIVFWDAGHVMLNEWLRFVTTHFDVRLPYNARAALPAVEFLKSLMSAFLAPCLDCGDIERVSLQPSLDMKFRNHLRAALGLDEDINASWLSPAGELLR
jgi:hypothetical protein